MGSQDFLTNSTVLCKDQKWMSCVCQDRELIVDRSLSHMQLEASRKPYRT